MTTSATSTTTPTPAPKAPSNPFGSPLHRRPFAAAAGTGLFAFDLESLQRHKGASPAKTPGATTSPKKQKPAVERQVRTQVTGSKPITNTSLRGKDGNLSQEKDRQKHRQRDTASQSQTRKPNAQQTASGVNVFEPSRTLPRTPPQGPSPTLVRSFGRPRSPNIPPQPPKAAAPKNIALGYGEDEKTDLVAALLERKRVLEEECRAIKRKCDELEISRQEEERRKKQKLAASGGDVSMAIPGEELDALIQSLLSANDSNLIAPKPPKATISASTSTFTSTSTTANGVDAIPSARPLPPPSDPFHPLYRTLCPFTFTSHTITLAPTSAYPATDPPTTITHHTLRGHTPHHLLSFRFEFDVARKTAGGKSTSTIINLPTTAVSSHAQLELSDILAVARARKDLLLAMTALGEYIRLATVRAEGWRVLANAYSGIAVTAAQPRGVRKGLGSRKRGWRRRRLDLLPYMGKRDMWFRPEKSGEAEGSGEMCVGWGLEFDLGTGMGRAVVGIEVALPAGSGSGGGGGMGRGKRVGSREVAMVGGLKGEVERVFEELVRQRGVLGGVRTIVGVLFGVEGVWEEEQEGEAEGEEGEGEGEEGKEGEGEEGKEGEGEEGKGEEGEEEGGGKEGDWDGGGDSDANGEGIE